MFITGLGTAAPSQCYSQKQCWEIFSNSALCRRLEPRSRAIVKKVLTGNNGIETRRLALGHLSQAFDLTPDALHARFVLHAPALATRAAERALAGAGASPENIDAVLISTCTGYLCPGLTSYVSQRLGLRSDVLPLDLVGQGCGAALPNLRMADALLRSGRCEQVLSICVEVCSAALYFDDDPGVLISACLFGDGAGAAVLSRQPNPQRLIRWIESGSLLDPQDRDLLRFEQKDGRLRNVLTPQVPALAAEHAELVFKEVMHRAALSQEQIAAWIWHAGGREVLLALQKRFGLREADLCWSADVLQELGNISSPFVFHVLQRALTHGAPGGFWWMSAFGAGFTCNGAVLEVEGR
jgi:alkylresorcinol/alkylpyrone synthase